MIEDSVVQRFDAISIESSAAGLKKEREGVRKEWFSGNYLMIVFDPHVLSVKRILGEQFLRRGRTSISDDLRRRGCIWIDVHSLLDVVEEVMGGRTGENDDD